MDKLILIGVIVKPQGIKGEVKVQPYIDDAVRFNTLKKVFIDNSEYMIEKVRISGNDLFLKFYGINDRNTSEIYRNKEIMLPRSSLDQPEEGRHLICDLIDSKVVAGGEEIGILTDILQHGAADVYVVTSKDGVTVMFPALKDLITEINIAGKRITLDSKRFQEVAVYED